MSLKGQVYLETSVFFKTIVVFLSLTESPFLRNTLEFKLLGLTSSRKTASMNRKLHNHTLQSNKWQRGEETHNTYSHKTTRRQK